MGRLDVLPAKILRVLLSLFSDSHKSGSQSVQVVHFTSAFYSLELGQRPVRAGGCAER